MSALGKAHPMKPETTHTPELKTSEQRREELRAAGRWPEVRVVRAGVSPMNPKVKWAELSCGHQVWRNRKPRIGAVIVCEQCAKAEGHR